LKKTPSTTPQIEFHQASKPIEQTPTSAPITAKLLMERFGIADIWRDLNMDKHHGVPAEHIILILLLYSSYNVDSVERLQKKAQIDRALAAVIESINLINNKLILYFQEINAPETLEKFLDQAVKSMQKHKRFASKKEGIIAVDDSTFEKTGKKMEHISIVFDHVEKRYILGYVIVSTAYADNKKTYPINFQFRLSTDKDQQDRQVKAIKKKHHIDLRKKGALLQFIDQCGQNNVLPDFINVAGQHLEPKTLNSIDIKNIPWIGIPNTKTPLLNHNNTRWDIGELKRKDLNKKPVAIDTIGWQIYSKEVFLDHYGKLDFIIVCNNAGQQLGIFVAKPLPMHEKVQLLQNYFERQEPADNNKLNIALKCIERAKEADIAAQTVSCDAWYFVDWFVVAVLLIPDIERVVSRMKKNYPIIYNGEMINAGELFNLLKFRPAGDRNRKVAAAKVQLQQSGTRVKLVLIQEFDKSRRLKAQFILVCTDIQFPTHKIIDAYKLRWSIEVFYRNAKQRFALTQFHTRRFEKVHCHVTIVFLAYLLVAQLKLCHPTLKELTFGEIIDQFLNSPVIIKIKRAVIHVYLDPAFVLAFGMPFDSS
jgi:hypothetical protein